MLTCKHIWIQTDTYNLQHLSHSNVFGNIPSFLFIHFFLIANSLSINKSLLQQWIFRQMDSWLWLRFCPQWEVPGVCREVEVVQEVTIKEWRRLSDMLVYQVKGCNVQVRDRCCSSSYGYFLYSWWVKSDCYIKSQYKSIWITPLLQYVQW